MLPLCFKFIHKLNLPYTYDYKRNVTTQRDFKYFNVYFFSIWLKHTDNILPFVINVSPVICRKQLKPTFKNSQGLIILSNNCKSLLKQ